MGIFILEDKHAAAYMVGDVLVQGFELRTNGAVGIELLELDEKVEVGTTDLDKVTVKEDSESLSLHFAKVESIDVVIEALQTVREILVKNGDAA